MSRVLLSFEFDPKALNPDRAPSHFSIAIRIILFQAVQKGFRYEAREKSIHRDGRATVPYLQKSCETIERNCRTRLPVGRLWQVNLFQQLGPLTPACSPTKLRPVKSFKPTPTEEGGATMTTIDADGHIVEKNSDIRKYLPEPYSKRAGALLPSDGLDTSMGGLVGGIEDNDIPTRLKDMDTEGIDVSVLFPTSSFAVNGSDGARLCRGLRPGLQRLHRRGLPSKPASQRLLRCCRCKIPKPQSKKPTAP